MRLADVKGRLIHDVFAIFNELTLLPAENPVDKVVAKGIIVGLANHTVLRHANGSLAPSKTVRHPFATIVEGCWVWCLCSAMSHMSASRKRCCAKQRSWPPPPGFRPPLRTKSTIRWRHLQPGLHGQDQPRCAEAVVRHLKIAEQELERVAHITRQTLDSTATRACPSRWTWPHSSSRFSVSIRTSSKRRISRWFVTSPSAPRTSAYPGK